MSTEEDDFNDKIAAIKGKQEKFDSGTKATSNRTPCRYGSKCWDTNPAHRAKFSHPASDSPPKEGSKGESKGAKRPLESPAAGGGGGPVKQTSLMGWINVKRKEGGGGGGGVGSGSESQEKKQKSDQEPPPRRPSRVSSDLLITAVEDAEKTTVFPSEIEEVPQELEVRMSAQQKFEGGGSRAWIDLSDKTPLPAMSIDAELPAGYADAWDDAHVRLPCSPRNTYRRNSNREKELSRWYLIQTSLSDSITTTSELHDAILSYHPKSASNWDFSGMHCFFNTMVTKDEAHLFFSSLLPRIIHLAFQLPHLCSSPISLLTPGTDRTVSLSQAQIASLLANAFLCTFPRQGPRGESSGDVNQEVAYQNVNMYTLWATPYGNQLPASQGAKVRCLLHYFDRVTRNVPTGRVTFRRLQLPAAPDWSNSNTPLSPITVHSAGLIEDEQGAIQIDFANKMIGGGVLGRGCIQEEIRFVINPELLISLLFTAQMGDREAVSIVGAERFSNYRGYGRTFEFSGPHIDKTPVDAQARRQTEVIAVDALYYGSSHRNRMAQWKDESVERELNKFYCGIQVFEPKAVPPPVATGNWGCGNFGGYHDLKAIVQWMAASEAGRPLIYFTFGEPGLAQQLRELAALLVQKSVNVGTLRRLMSSISQSMYKGGEAEASAMPQLFNILFDKYES